MSRVLVVTALAVALLAGCVQQQAGGPNDGTSPPPSPNPDEIQGSPVASGEARTTMLAAFSAPATDPSVRKFETRFTAFKNGTSVASLHLIANDDTKETSFEVSGFENLSDSPSSGFGGEGFNLQTFSVYNIMHATVIALEAGKAFALYDENTTERGNSSFFKADPEDESDGPSTTDAATPFFGAFQDFEDFEVKSAESITYRGKAALKIVFEHTDEDGEVTKGTVVVFVSPERVAYIDAEVPPDPENPNSPTHVTAEFFYGAESTGTPPAPLVRAAKLAVKASGGGFGGFGGFGSGESSRTVRFWGEGRVDVGTSDVDLVVTPSKGGDALTMRLSEGSAGNENLNVTFVDADGDGKVSRGDSYTVTVTAEDESLSDYTIELVDRVTGLRVTPAPWAFALLAALGLALIRRRS